MTTPMFTPNEKQNPFLKSLKKPKVNKTPNPLSLTDPAAGIAYEKETKENKNKNAEVNYGRSFFIYFFNYVHFQVGEKRKFSDSDNEKQKEKQRKLDCFKFSKKTV